MCLSCQIPIFQILYLIKDSFIRTNVIPEINHCTIWETFKAYLRGQLISYASYERKEHLSILTHITYRISYLDRQYATSPSAKLYKERLLLQTEFDNLSTVKAEKMLLKSRHVYYEFGDKPTRLLAHQLRQSSASQLI